MYISSTVLYTHPILSTDSVVRTCYYKYFHPKECLITNGILNRAILEASGKNIPGLLIDDALTTRLVLVTCNSVNIIPVDNTVY